MARLKHYDLPNNVRFITFSCFRYRRLLTEAETYKEILTILDQIRIKYELAILGYVVMPNHMHLVILPQKQIKLARVIGEFKWQSARRLLEIWKKQNRKILNEIRAIRNGRIGYSVWQRRCYDHNCRDVQSVREKINYCHNNPVKAGLVSTPNDWPWSSYRWYNGDKSGLVAIDEIDLL